MQAGDPLSLVYALACHQSYRSDPLKYAGSQGPMQLHRGRTPKPSLWAPVDPDYLCGSQQQVQQSQACGKGLSFTPSGRSAPRKYLQQLQAAFSKQDNNVLVTSTPSQKVLKLAWRNKGSDGIQSGRCQDSTPPSCHRMHFGPVSLSLRLLFQVHVPYLCDLSS